MRQTLERVVAAGMGICLLLLGGPPAQASVGPSACQSEAVQLGIQANLTTPFSLPGFDSTIGTLTSVEITAYLSTQNVDRVEHTGPSTVVGTCSFTIRRQTQGAIALGQTLLTSTSIDSNLTATLAFYDGVMDFAGASGEVFSPAASSWGWLDAPGGAALSDFVDAPSIDFSASLSSAFSFSALGCGPLVLDLATSASLYVSINYYCNIPSWQAIPTLVE